jgi:hypothetical protein
VDQADNINHENDTNEERSGIPVRLGCISILLFTIICTATLLLVVNLVVDGEIKLSRGELEGYRIWVVRGEGFPGFGFSSSKELKSDGDPGVTCIETRVRFLVLQSETEIEPTVYCECYELDLGQWNYIGDCP